MKRSDVWWINFGPSIGGEIQKQRLAVIMSKKQLINPAGSISSIEMEGVGRAITIYLYL